LCLVGDGELRNSLETYAREHGIASQLHFLGWQENMPEIYGGIDLLLLTSNNEGTPVAIIEAQASLVPVIATAVGGVLDLITPDNNGWLVAAGDAVAMAEKILHIAAHPEVSRKITAAARNGVISRFQYTDLIQKIDDLYRDLLSRKSPCK
ncbi:glycosyltransferase, partial [bacterium]|nr:glycosyltransferase [bacterium]